MVSVVCGGAAENEAEIFLAGAPHEAMAYRHVYGSSVGYDDRGAVSSPNTEGHCSQPCKALRPEKGGRYWDPHESIKESF